MVIFQWRCNKSPEGITTVCCTVFAFTDMIAMIARVIPSAKVYHGLPIKVEDLTSNEAVKHDKTHVDLGLGLDPTNQLCDW